MKSRLNFVHTLVTILITSILFIAFYFFVLSDGNRLSIGDTTVSVGKKGSYISVGSTISTVSFENNSKNAPLSERITWEDAVELRQEYKKYKPLQVEHKGTSGRDSETKASLEGFVFDAQQLAEIINYNRSREAPDKVIFYFGQKGVADANTASEHGIIKIIAVGMKNNKLLVNDFNNEGKSSVFDKADPCPPFCPEL